MAAGALIFYSINDRGTFEHLPSWINDGRHMARSDISVVLVGNKSDLKDERQVTFLEASCLPRKMSVISRDKRAEWRKRGRSFPEMRDCAGQN